MEGGESSAEVMCKTLSPPAAASLPLSLLGLELAKLLAKVREATPLHEVAPPLT